MAAGYPAVLPTGQGLGADKSRRQLFVMREFATDKNELILLEDGTMKAILMADAKAVNVDAVFKHQTPKLTADTLGIWDERTGHVVRAGVDAVATPQPPGCIIGLRTGPSTIWAAWNVFAVDGQDFSDTRHTYGPQAVPPKAYEISIEFNVDSEDVRTVVDGGAEYDVVPAEIVQVNEASTWHTILSQGWYPWFTSTLFIRCPDYVDVATTPAETMSTGHMWELSNEISLSSTNAVQRSELLDQGVKNYGPFGVDVDTVSLQTEPRHRKTQRIGDAQKLLATLAGYMQVFGIEELPSTHELQGWNSAREGKYLEQACPLHALMLEKRRSTKPLPKIPVTRRNTIHVNGQEVTVPADFYRIVQLITHLANFSSALVHDGVQEREGSTVLRFDTSLINRVLLSAKRKELVGIDKRKKIHIGCLLFSAQSAESLVRPMAMSTYQIGTMLTVRPVLKPGSPPPWATPAPAPFILTYNLDYSVASKSNGEPNDVFMTYLPHNRTVTANYTDWSTSKEGDLGDIILPTLHTAGAESFTIYVKRSNVERSVSFVFTLVDGLYHCDTRVMGRNRFLNGWWVPQSIAMGSGDVVFILTFLCGIDRSRQPNSGLRVPNVACEEAGYWARALAPRLLNGKGLDLDSFGDTGARDPYMLLHEIESGDLDLSIARPRDCLIMFLVVSYLTVDRTLMPARFPAMQVALLGKYANTYKRHVTEGKGALTPQQAVLEAENSDGAHISKDENIIFSYFRDYGDIIYDPDGTKGASASELEDAGSWGDADVGSLFVLLSLAHMEPFRFAGWNLTPTEQATMAYGPTAVPLLCKRIIDLFSKYVFDGDGYAASYEPLLARFLQTPVGEATQVKVSESELFTSRLRIRGGKTGRHISDDLSQADDTSKKDRLCIWSPRAPVYVCGPVVPGSDVIIEHETEFHSAIDSYNEFIDSSTDASVRLSGFATAPKRDEIPNQSMVDYRYPYGSNMAALNRSSYMDSARRVVGKLRRVIFVERARHETLRSRGVDDVDTMLIWWLELLDEFVFRVASKDDPGGFDYIVDRVTELVNGLTMTAGCKPREAKRKLQEGGLFQRGGDGAGGLVQRLTSTTRSGLLERYKETLESDDFDTISRTALLSSLWT